MFTAPPVISRRSNATAAILFALILSVNFSVSQVRGDDDLFETHVRPVLVEHCQECHSGNEPEAGLSVTSRASLLEGGDSGPAIVPGAADSSLLVAAMQHQNGLEMPPDGKLNDLQIKRIREWIDRGAIWSGPDSSSPAAVATLTPLRPDSSSLQSELELWLSGSTITLADQEPVHVWPDQSGHGRDVSATRGIRADGVGLPGFFQKQSKLNGRPAIRFTTETGFAASPDAQPNINGDAALSILLVIHLSRHEAMPPFDGILGIGNPAYGGDPGKPLAALVQINRNEDHALHFAGGWNHDASAGMSSFQPFYDQPTLLTIVKRPGRMKQTTEIYVNGSRLSATAEGELEGTDAIPMIEHRSDIGIYLGKALSWCGSIQGDVGEVIVYSRALDANERQGIELHLADQYGIWMSSQAAPASTFRPEELSHWAYQALVVHAPPAVTNESLVLSDIDRFVLHRLEAEGLTLAPPANKADLLRRVTYSLTGLPPTSDEIDAFCKDDRPEALAEVVDRLLQSPHYGEHWGRHWLDNVRYAESTANDANAIMSQAWRYRDYVIDSFNRDLPYDQFIVEQIAGDLLPTSDSPSENARRLIATGFLMIGPKALAETDKEQSRLDIVDDQIDVLGRAVLGLTLGCARCHDHKFDAIRARDYYALAGIFRSTEPFQDENRNATMWWEFPVSLGDGTEPIMVMSPKETSSRNLRIHVRGNRFTLGAAVERGAPAVIEAVNGLKCDINPNQPASGRLELANWIVDPKNPLTARVIVNRVWQHHFGRGIVTTSDNFGTRGETPTHPELLDWLAHRFIESGWSLKQLHRIIILSATYQQAIVDDDKGFLIDPERRLLWSFAPRRLSAEELRDSLLAVSGQLDRSPGGSASGEFLYARAEDIGSKIRPNRVTADDPFYMEFRHRSVYLPMVRNMLPDVLALFDAADPNSVTTVRTSTTVASQALFMLNSPFVIDQARGIASQLVVQTELTDEARIDAAFRKILGRRARDDERAASLEFVRSQMSSVQGADPVNAWGNLCHVLLCSNEFAYVP